MRPRRLLAAVALSLALATVGSAVAHAGTVPVDPGAKVSAGKPITGSGQNLPSLEASATWDIGPYPAPQLEAYYTSGEAARDQQAVANAALAWTKSWLRKECGSTRPAAVRACRAAAVFDVDDTLLDWYPVLSTLEPAFTWNSQTSATAIAECSTPVIEATRTLYRTLQRWGVTTFIVTGRSESDRAATASCLESHGISGWRQMVLREEGDVRPASVYKSQARRGFEKQGWRIGPSTGDQVSDMALGFLEHGFLVPNGMYFIP